MSNTAALKPSALTVIYYVEAGCLGANGDKLIDGFCDFMSLKVNQTNNELCVWSIQVLTDIHKPHIEYFIQQKKLDSRQARVFLKKYGKDIDVFEESIDDLVINTIEDYLGRS